jgi:hypothetical protein
MNGSYRKTRTGAIDPEEPLGTTLIDHLLTRAADIHTRTRTIGNESDP